VGLCYGSVIAGIEAKSHFFVGNGNIPVADKPNVRPVTSHQESKTAPSHRQTVEMVQTSAVETVLKNMGLENMILKKAVHVEEKQAKLNSETAVQELANAHLKNKAALKKAVKAEVVAGKDAVIEPKVHKTNHKTQAPVKPHMPKALALGALGSEIKTVAQKALHVVNRRHVAQVKRGVKAATTAQKEEKKSLDDLQHVVPEADFTESIATLSSSPDTVEDIVKEDGEKAKQEAAPLPR
jgi:hypothetical protein